MTRAQNRRPLDPPFDYLHIHRRGSPLSSTSLSARDAYLPRGEYGFARPVPTGFPQDRHRRSPLFGYPGGLRQPFVPPHLSSHSPSNTLPRSASDAKDHARTASAAFAGMSSSSPSPTPTPNPSNVIPPPPSNTTDTSNPSGSNVPPPQTGVSSSLYLFTFLITILVLALISAGLLGRAFFVRRRFQRRVEAAIRTGEPLPQEAAVALGLIQPPRRGKKEKKVGPMPAMWEAEMLLDRSDHEQGDGELEKGWGDVHPLTVLQFPPGPAPPPAPPTITFDGPIPRTRFFGLITTQPFPRPQLDRGETALSLKPPSPTLEVPPPGTEVAVGVLIALPFQPGSAEGDRWHPPEEGEEEGNVPEVVLGVMGATIEESGTTGR